MPRPVTHLANLDLNLLVALRELLRERSVTRAAERLGVTQPAASAALARLRRHFGDELLVRDRGEYTLTALGVQLAEQSEAVCTAAQRLFAASADFDPATSEREFTLVMADYTIVVMGEGLSQVIARAAPRARLHIRLVRETLSAEYAEGIRFIDGMIAPPTHGFALPDTRSAELFRDRWVCLVDARRHGHHQDQHQVGPRRRRHPGARPDRPGPGPLPHHPHRRLGPGRRHPRPDRGQTGRKELTAHAPAQQLRAGDSGDQVPRMEAPGQRPRCALPRR
jgi:DNA-binding transcriptional LysR family regulator